jgi:hypothetical protein
MHDEHGNIAKKLGNFSIAVTAALLATASGHAATTNPAAEMQASGSQARFSPIAPAGPSHIPTLMDFSQSHRFVDTDRIPSATPMVTPPITITSTNLNEADVAINSITPRPVAIQLAEHRLGVVWKA